MTVAELRAMLADAQASGEWEAVFVATVKELVSPSDGRGLFILDLIKAHDEYLARRER